jgi:hypothetical protein
LVQLERLTEVTGEQPADVVQVLDRQRLVQTLVVLERPDLLLARLEAQDSARRAARQLVEQVEDDDGHDEDHDDGLRDPPCQVAQHQEVVQRCGCMLARGSWVPTFTFFLIAEIW